MAAKQQPTQIVSQMTKFGGGKRVPQGTALEEAEKMLNKLMSLRFGRAPMPTKAQKTFSIATLPKGNLLMSDASTKVSPAMKKFKKEKSKEEDIFVGPGQKPQGRSIIEDIALQIAVPAKHMGTAEDKVFAFSNYLSKLLRPTPANIPGVGLPAFLPSPKDVQPFYRPSAIANLPPMIRKTAQIFAGGQPRFFDNTQRIRKALAQQFLRHFARGERPAAYASLGGMGRTPLIARQDAAAFRIPTEQNVKYAQISRTPTVGAGMIQ